MASEKTQGGRVSLVCDGCGYSRAYMYSAQKSRQRSIRDGWQPATFSDRRDFCPACVRPTERRET